MFLVPILMLMLIFGDQPTPFAPSTTESSAQTGSLLNVIIQIQPERRQQFLKILQLKIDEKKAQISKQKANNDELMAKTRLLATENTITSEQQANIDDMLVKLIKQRATLDLLQVEMDKKQMELDNAKAFLARLK